MSLSAVYQQLGASITGGAIDLYAAATTQPALQPLTGVLALFRITSSWRLTGVSLTQTSGSVVLTGDGSFGVPGAAPANVSAIAARLTVTSPDAVDRFVLALSITAAGWTFPTMFPTLPVHEQRIDKAVSYRPSFFSTPPMPLNRPVLVGSSQPGLLRLQGELPMVGVLAQFIGLLGPGPLRLDGTVVLPASPSAPPELDLVAVASGSSLTASFVSTLQLRELGLQLATNTEVDPEIWGISALSVMNLNATLYLGDPPVTAHLFTSILAASDTWRLFVGFDPGELPLTQGLALVASFFGIPISALPLPTGFDDFTGFYFSMIEVAIQPPGATGLPQVGYLAMTLGSDKVWQPPIPFVTIENTGTRWVLSFVQAAGQSVPSISGSIYGSIVVGGAPWQPSAAATRTGRALVPAERPRSLARPRELAAGNTFHIDVAALVPQWSVSGQLRDDDEIPLGAMLSYYFGGGVPPGTPQGMAVTAFAFEAAPFDQSYSASAEITMDWTVPLGGNVALHLTGLGFYLEAAAGTVSGGISAVLALAGGAPPGWPDPVFSVSADYLPAGAGASGWRFAGQLYPDTALELVALVSNFLGITPPSSLPSLSLERLALSFQTVDQTYAIAGTVIGRWTPTLFGTTLAISAQAAADIAKTTAGGTASGRLVGRFAINKIALEVGMDVGVEEPTYQLRVELGQLWLGAVTSWTGTAPSRHQVVTVQLGGMTLGGILEYLVNLASPTLGYHLEAPWNALDRIELSRFQLRIDPTENLVDFTYQVDVNLVVMRVDRIGVRYQKINGVPSVSLALTGSFLGQSYPDSEPLSWDVVNDPPPAVPGQGTSLVELYYLGLGQHVTLRDIDSLQTVRETLDRLIADMGEVTDPNKSPLQQPGGAKMRFAADSEWLIGLDVWLMETVRLGLIFNDPRLYGLSIELGGESAGSLAGLKFEILYKKITDDIGMFRVELRLPEAFRHIELGEVSITLGIIVVEIYTNGNFLIDLGFPYDRNFDRSFTVQVFPFLGRGGIYFGVRDGATSTRVPRISNGTFSPVLELGIGLAVGVGKEISIGPLSGGIYVQLEVIFQGVLAWFHPSSSGGGTAMYYWVQGIAALHGKLYGAVDFKVIKVSVTLDAYAQVSVVFESYRPAQFRLDVAVSVKASIKILFVRIRFSFGVHLDVSFTIGSEQRTPWILAGAGGGGGAQLTSPARAARQGGQAAWLPAARRRPAQQRQVLLAQHLGERRRAGLRAAIPRGARTLAVSEPFADEAYVLHWDATAKVFPDAPRAVPLTMLPSFGVDQLPIAWSGAAPPLVAPAYRVAFLLFAPNGHDEGDSDEARPARSARRSAHAETTQELSTDTLIEAFLRWSIAAVAPGEPTINAGQLDVLSAQITWPQTRDAGFSLANLATFFTTNLALQIAGDPGGSPSSVGGMAFPIPPYLSWSSPQAGPRDFASYHSVGSLYEWGVASYVASFDPIAPPPGPPPPDDPAAYESFSAFAFRDYCLMLARGALQSASDAMNAWPYVVSGAQSLTDIADAFPRVTVQYPVRAGDSVDSVAAALGATPAELLYLNPTLPAALAAASAGQALAIVLGIAPEVVATDNPAVPLALTSAVLRAVPVQAQRGDTLNGIAARFGLASTSELLPGLVDDRQLLQPGATFTAAATAYTPPVAMTAVAVAATMFVRYRGDTSAAGEVPSVDWYAQTIFDLNQATLASGLTWNDPLPVGSTLFVPGALGDPSPAQQLPYTVLAGDTIARVAAAQALAQNYATGAGPIPAWPPFRDAVTPTGSAFSIPATSVAIALGESINRLADRTLIFAGDAEGLLAWIGGAAVLAPLAVITIPRVTAAIASGDTLTTLAARYGLSLAELATQLATAAPIFAEATVVTIAHLPVQEVDALVARVLAGDAPGQISGMTSRQLFSGLDLPAPVESQGHQAATGALTAFYDLSGQQLVGPTPDLTQPDAVALAVTFTVDAAAASWISLVGSTTVDEHTQLDEALLRHNRALATSGLVLGQVVTTGAVDELPFSYSNAQLAALYPQRGLAVTPLAGPSPLPNAGRTPRTYGLDHHLELQASSPLPIPTSGGGALTGNPSLWPFPAALLALARAATATPYELIAAPPDGKTAPYTLTSATFATTLPFGVRRLDEGEGVYALLGADTADRQLLLALWRYLADPATPAGTQAYLAVAPSPDAGNASGLAVLALDAAQTYLLKTNLSTETRSGAQAARARARADVADGAAPSPYAAPFSSLAEFLLLLWEGSVVGGNGYWLGLATAGGGAIPASSFDGDGKAELVLVVIVGAQQAAISVGRPLLPFNNCAAVAPGFDPSTTLFAEAADASDLIVQPLLPPGNAGFVLSVPKPPPPETSAQAALQQMFSLLTYALVAGAGSPFSASEAGLPIGPEADDSGGLEAYQRARRQRRIAAGLERAAVDDASTWRYQRVVPVARFGPPSVTPAVLGLPPPAQDPYRGLAGQSGVPVASFALGFADVLGNVTAPPSSPVQVSAPAGYTDALIGVTTWPAVTSWFSVLPAPDGLGGAELLVTVAPQPSVGAPTPSQSPVAALAALAKQAERYRQIYYQVLQPDVGAALLTSLSQTGDGAPVVRPAALAPLRRFAVAALLQAQALASLAPLRPDLTLAPTLGQVATSYGVGFAELAQANLDAPIVELFGAVALNVPAYVVFADGSSAASIVAGLGAGWPTPTAAALLALPDNAAALPLRPGTVLAIPPRAVPIVGEPTPSLAALALAAFTQPGLFAADNPAVPLADGFVFTVEGVRVTAASAGPATLLAVQAAFAALGVNVTLADLGTDNAAAPGMFPAAAAVVTAHYVAQAGDTLAANASGQSVSTLAAQNTATPNLFDSGALVFLGDFAPAPQLDSGELHTLGEFAARYGCPPAQLLAANPGALLPPTNAWIIPGGLALPPAASEAPLYAAVQLRDGETLDLLAPRFAAAPGPATGPGSAATNLAAANLELPDTLTPGVSITVTVGGTSYQTTTVPGDSFASVLARLGAAVTLAELIAVIGGQPGVLQTGAVLVAPLALMPAGGLTPAGVPARYGVAAAAFGEANLALAGLLAPAIPLRSPDGAVTVTTAARDTLNAVVARFAAAGVQLSVAQLLEANPTAPLFVAAALALLPAAPAYLSAVLPAGAGPFAAPIFPLTVALRLQRDEALVDPQFRVAGGGGPTARADSTVPAPARTTGPAGAQSETFDQFAATFETALPNLRLGTGKTEATEADLWVVDFGASGIAQLDVGPSVPSPSGALWPRFFALRPLYNDLVSRTVVLPVVRPDGTLVEASEATSLQGIDVELWARRLLADVDRFLGVPYAPGAHGVAPAALDRVLAAKQALMQAIPDGLAPVLQLPDSGVASGQLAAAEALAQQLGIQLSRAYATAAIVQYAATVRSVWTTSSTPPLPARVVGQPTPLTADPARTYSLGGAKTSLDRASSWVSVLLSVADPAHHANVSLDLDYAITDVEFDIAAVAETAGYEASSWLSLLPPITYDDHPASVAAQLGVAKVPIPLRAYPALPALLGQTAAPTFAGPGVPTLAQAKLWTFGLTYSHEHADQDEVIVTARYNVAPPPSDLRLAAQPDVASALARYIGAADRLWALLAGFTEPGGDPTVLANASASFATLVDEVTTAWRAHWSGASLDAPAPRSLAALAEVSYALVARLIHSEEEPSYLKTLALTSQQASPGPTGAWPAAWARLPGGEQVALLPGPAVDGTVLYQFPETPRLLAGEWPEITLEWDRIDAVTHQNARAQVQVRRNHELLPGVETTEGFVYRTPTVDAPDVVTPLNAWTDPIALTGSTVTAALQTAFTTLFGAALGAPITVGMFYGYALVPAPQLPSGGLITYLPVALFPDQALSATTADQLAAALDVWWRANQPAVANGSWVFSLTTYSQVDPNNRHPLLSFERLVYAIAP